MASTQPPRRDDEPLVPDHVEYMDESATAGPGGRSPVPPGHYENLDFGPIPAGAPAFDRMRMVVLQRDEIPCCSGCGCIAFLFLGLIFLQNAGGILGTLLLVVASMWISATLLRLAGVSRISPLYVFAIVPLFLLTVNFLLGLLKHGQQPFSLLHILGVTLAIYAFLLFARHLGRR